MAGDTEQSRRKAATTRASAAKAKSAITRPRAVSSGTQTQSISGPDGDDAVARLEAVVGALTAERERLKADLANAENRIAVLETQHRDAIDRINWVIDSLQTAIDE